MVTEATLKDAFSPADELTWCIGPPLHGSLKKLLGSDELADRALVLYRERFADVGLFENQVYPGIEDTLSTLARSGLPPAASAVSTASRCEG